MDIDVFNTIPTIKVGNILTSLEIINNGNNLYTTIPNIYALYKNTNDKFVVDTQLKLSNGTDIDYDIVDGNIKGKVLSNSINIAYADNKYTSVQNTKIVVGGEVSEIKLVNPNSPDNVGFTSNDKLLVGNTISKLKLIHCGDELEDIFTTKHPTGGDYELLFKNNENVILNKYIQYRLFIGGDNNVIKKRIYTCDTINDGGGFGCVVEPVISLGTGAIIKTLMGIDSIDVSNGGINYTDNDIVIIDSGYQDLFKNSVRWNSIPKSLYISNNKTIEYAYIRAFIENCLYTEDRCIPFINTSNSRFYTRDIIKNITLSIDNVERESEKAAEFYKSIEKLELLNTSDNNDIYFYSFALDNNIVQASGHINLAHFNKMQFVLDLKNPKKVNKDLKYNVDLYINYYNVIDYSNGIGALKYAN